MKFLTILLTTLLFFSCGKKEKTDNSRKNVNAVVSDSVKQAIADSTKQAVIDSIKRVDSIKQAVVDSIKKIETINKVSTTPISSNTVDASILLKNSNSGYQYQFYKNINNKNKAELWKMYKAARSTAKTMENNGNLSGAISQLLLAGETAIVLDRRDIASWQFNNAGKIAINLYMQKTDYTNSMNRLNNMQWGDEKTTFKNNMIMKMREYLPILDNAERYLKEALLNNTISPDNTRESTIKSNLNFISQARLFCNQ